MRLFQEYARWLWRQCIFDSCLLPTISIETFFYIFIRTHLPSRLVEPTFKNIKKINAASDFMKVFCNFWSETDFNGDELEVTPARPLKATLWLFVSELDRPTSAFPSHRQSCLRCPLPALICRPRLRL
jgi:hypothetical protein